MASGCEDGDRIVLDAGIGGMQEMKRERSIQMSWMTLSSLSRGSLAEQVPRGSDDDRGRAS